MGPHCSTVEHLLCQVASQDILEVRYDTVSISTMEGRKEGALGGR